LDAKFAVSGHAKSQYGPKEWSVKPSWNEVFSIIAPHLLEQPSDGVVKSKLVAELFKRSGKPGFNPEIDDDIFQTIKIQLMAHGLIIVQYLKTTQGGMALFWSLTKKGAQAMLSLRTVRSQ